MILLGILSFVIQIIVSIVNREKLRDLNGDTWGDGRTLEWSTSSPPPEYNFAFTPVVHKVDTWWDMKTRGYRRPLGGFKPILMPRNTGSGVYVSALSLVFCFAMVWYMWWLAIISFAALVIVAVGHTFDYNRNFHITADEVARAENERTRLLASQGKA